MFIDPIYKLLNNFKSFRKYQQRINLDLLSGIANCLLHDTIFEIVKGLKEIQDVTEKHLFQTRLQLLETHRGKFCILFCEHNP